MTTLDENSTYPPHTTGARATAMNRPNALGRRHFLTGLLSGALSLVTLPASAAPGSRSLLIQRSPVAGFQYHQGESLWPQLRTGDRLNLVREADNPHDDRAVRVDWRDHKLGYVPRRENTAVAQMLDRRQRLEARIASLGAGPDPWNRIELEVRLKG